MADRDRIVAFLNDLLRIEAYPDMLPVGLQVPGAVEVRRVATGVSASLELFRRTVEAGAELLIVHHGLFYGSGPQPPLSVAAKERLRTLFDADVSLLAYHLALDAHPTVGNNAVICGRLGLQALEPFGQHGTHTLGFVGGYATPVTLTELLDRVRSEITPQPLVLGHGPERIGRVAVISGAASEYVDAAAAAGADCYITGEPTEQTMWAADEAGIHVVAAGHYATEVFGVRALGELLAERFGVEHVFIDVPNPV